MMISNFRLFFFVVLVHSGVVIAEDISSMNLRYEQWELSRHGEKLINIADLNELVSIWSENAGKILELHYPGGEQGELWVRELMDWLIALGVPSTSMYAVPGSGNEDIIKILLVQGKK